MFFRGDVLQAVSEGVSDAAALMRLDDDWPFRTMAYVPGTNSAEPHPTFQRSGGIGHGGTYLTKSKLGVLKSRRQRPNGSASGTAADSLCRI